MTYPGSASQYEPAAPTVAVQFSPTTNPGDTPVWVTIPTTEQLTVKRGYAYEQRRAQPGAATVNIDNSSGAYTAGNAASPYWPGVTTDKPVQILLTPPSPYNGLTYTLHRGTADSWPTSLDEAGAEYAQTQLATLDDFDLLNAVTLKPAIMAEILADSPAAYYPMSDAAGITAASSMLPGVGAAPLRYYGSTGSNGSRGSYAFGGTALAASDPGTSLVLAPNVNIPPPAGSSYTSVSGGWILRPDLATVPPPQPTGDCTIEMVAAISAGNFYQGVVLGSVYDSKGNQLLTIFVAPTAVYALGGTPSDGSAGAQVTFPSTVGSDLASHSIAASVATSGGTQTVTLVIDGVVQTAQTTKGMRALTGPMHTQIGGDAARVAALGLSGQNPDGTDSTRFMACVIEHVAVHNRAVPSARLAMRYAAMNGFPSDLAGTRIGRILGYAGVPSSLQALDPGRTALGPMVVGGTKALQAVQDTADVDQGVFFISGSGVHTFQDRAHGLNQTSKVVLNTPLLPVEADITFATDRQYLENDITGTRQGSVSQRVTDATSITQHRTRTTSYTYNFTNDDDVLAAIQWRLLRFSQPGIRSPQISLRPVTSPALWPWVCSLEVGDRITVANLPATAPATQMDFVILNVAVTEATPQQWTWTYLLAPADTTSYWVIDDATYGGVDQNVIAF